MSHSRKHLGKKGEDLAAAYLTKNNFKILCRNYSCNLGEIDIIACHRGNLVFSEVKTRTSSSFGSPASAVTLKKQQQIIKVAQLYVQKHKLEDVPTRFDVVCVMIKADGRAELQLITNAFDCC